MIVREVMKNINSIFHLPYTRKYITFIISVYLCLIGWLLIWCLIHCTVHMHTTILNYKQASFEWLTFSPMWQEVIPSAWLAAIACLSCYWVHGMHFTHSSSVWCYLVPLTGQMILSDRKLDTTWPSSLWNFHHFQHPLSIFAFSCGLRRKRKMYLLL